MCKKVLILHTTYHYLLCLFIPEMLRRNFVDLEQAFEEAWQDPTFQSQYRALLRDFVGRPTPLQRADRWSERCGVQVLWYTRAGLRQQV